MTPRSLALTAALAVALGAPARADAPSPPDAPQLLSTPARASASGEAPTLHGALGLSLADAVAMGLENNLDVEIARHEPLIAQEDLTLAWSAYDPLLSGEAGYLDDSQPNAFVLTGVAFQEQQRADGRLGVSALVPFVGATLGIDYAASRLEDNNIFQSLRPQYDASLEFSANIPLARNLVWNRPWTEVRARRIGLRSSEEGFRRAVMDMVRNVETAYWNLVAMREQARVADKSLETARALLEQVQTQYEVGVVSRVEVVEAEAGVAEREVALIRAINLERSAQDQLIDLVLGPHLTAASRLGIEPIDSPEDYVPYEVDTEVAVERAFARRPELRAAELGVENQRLQLRFARNQRLPQVDLQASYGTAGKRGIGAVSPDIFDRDMDGDTDELVQNPTTGRSLSAANDDFFGRRGGDRYVVRGIVSIPLGNVAGRHGVSRAKLELRRAEKQLARTRQAIILEVRNGARNLLSALEGIEAAERRRAAAQEQLRAERVRLEHGESTPFEVLQRERDLVDAQSQKIAALQLYRTSEAELLRAQGTILEARDVVIDDARPLR